MGSTESSFWTAGGTRATDLEGCFRKGVSNWAAGPGVLSSGMAMLGSERSLAASVEPES